MPEEAGALSHLLQTTVVGGNSFLWTRETATKREVLTPYVPPSRIHHQTIGSRSFSKVYSFVLRQVPSNLHSNGSLSRTVLKHGEVQRLEEETPSSSPETVAKAIHFI